jgi:hypothetical protein
MIACPNRNPFEDGFAARRFCYSTFPLGGLKFAGGTADSFPQGRDSLNMRMSFLAVLALLTAAAFGASHAETTTYIDGNLPGVSPNTGGTLLYSEEKAMYFRTGLVNIPVNYDSISHAELGAQKVASHDVPLYKVWALHKRFSEKTKTQYLVVNFKNDAGEEKNMTLELATPAASDVLSAIESRNSKVTTASTKPELKPERETPKKEAKVEKKPAPEKTAQAKTEAKNAWWGDDYWKTTRNQDKWSKPATAPAPDQR